MNKGHRRDQKTQTGFAVLTTSDSRTKEEDKSGKTAQEIIVGDGHEVIEYQLVQNKPDEIRNIVSNFLENPEVRVIVTSGGTGVGNRDVTVRTIAPMFDKELQGFGELFRRFSFEEIGIPGIYSQATAGLIGNTVVFCLPGSTNAMKTAMERIILPGIGHLLWEVDR